MAVHKVPQDVEAEDKFLGPLTFKQFLFGGGVAITGYLIFFFMSNGIWPLAIVVLPFFLGFAALAFPWSKEQPTELWLAARIRFFLVPRRRIWDQTGMSDFVRITAPKREVHAMTDGLSQHEVQNRLTALASLVDSRGWAIKNVSGYATMAMSDESDRLATGTSSSAPPTNDQSVISAPDVMDEAHNPLAQQFDTMMKQSEDKHKNDALALIEKARQATEQKQQAQSASPTPKKAHGKQAAPGTDFSFLNAPPAMPAPGLASFQEPIAQVTPGSSPATQTQSSSQVIGMGVPTHITAADEASLLEKAHKQQAIDKMLSEHRHMRTVLPASEQAKQKEQQQAKKAKEEAVTHSVNPDILKLATNDDLNVETLARQAKKEKSPPDDEVVITLR